MSEINLSLVKQRAENYVDNLCKMKKRPNKLHSLSLEDKFMLDTLMQGYVFAYHSMLQEVLSEKGIQIEDLEP